MKNFNDINNKLPKINKFVFIFKKDLSKLRYAKLSIYNHQDKIYSLNEADRKKNKLEHDDIFWRISGIPKNKWATIDNFPYWIEEKVLINLLIEETNRFEILDL